MSGPPGGEERTVLGGATRYLLQSVRLARGVDLSALTPCPDWNLSDLLDHVRSSLDDLTTVLTSGEPPGADGPDPDPVVAIRVRIIDLLVAWAAARPADTWCRVGDRRIPAEIVVYTAATEMVLHGWDISRTCGAEHPIPGRLAESLLTVSPALAEAGAADRAFGTPLGAPATAAPGERLLARYGRSGTPR